MAKQGPWYENYYPDMTQQERLFEKLRSGALFLSYQIQVLCLVIVAIASPHLICVLVSARRVAVS